MTYLLVYVDHFLIIVKWSSYCPYSHPTAASSLCSKGPRQTTSFSWYSSDPSSWWNLSSLSTQICYRPVIEKPKCSTLRVFPQPWQMDTKWLPMAVTLLLMLISIPVWPKLFNMQPSLGPKISYNVNRVCQFMQSSLKHIASCQTHFEISCWFSWF